MQKKLPAFQFYPGDWRKDPSVSLLNLEQKGAYIELLLMMHESSERGVLSLNGKPLPTNAIARLLGVSTQKAGRLIAQLLEYGTLSKNEYDALYSRRMVRDEHIRKVRSEAGSLGGNPHLLKQKPKQVVKQSVKQNKPPSSSSSSSSSSSLKKNIYGEYKNVRLTKEDQQKLEERFPNDWRDRIKELDEGIEVKGYKYKNHYLAILKWARKKGPGMATTKVFVAPVEEKMTPKDKADRKKRREKMEDKAAARGEIWAKNAVNQRNTTKP